MRIIFLGTSEFACPSLESLLHSPHEIVFVVTQPDRPRGRGRKLSPSPVKSVAAANQVPVFQPEKIRDAAAVEFLKSLGAEMLVVVAYGQILSKGVLSIPPRGCINVHGSLLPAYRGAAPIVRAILAGESRTGVTTMFLDEGMDTGPVLLKRETEIEAEDTAGTLHDRLARMGAALLLETLERIEDGTLRPQPQDPSRATYAPKITKGEEEIRWERPARDLFNLIRGFDPWPGAFTLLNGRRIKLYRPVLLTGEGEDTPGTLVRSSPEGLLIAGFQGRLLIREVQLENRPRMGVVEFLRGSPLQPGVRLGV